MKLFIASPWRNKEAVQHLADALTARGHGVYSFLNNGANLASGESVSEEVVFRKALMGEEDDPLIAGIFAGELAALKACDAVILLEPAGHSSLTEAGIAYGLGKPVMLVGFVERPEIVYRICTYRYPNAEALVQALDQGPEAFPAAA